MEKRETLSNRLGFILLSAGCAIGLGNIWRFPYITGQYGGGLFVLIYIVFLVILGLPIMTAEFAVGRGSQRSVARAFHELQGTRQKWSLYGYIAMAGNYFLMMFYTTVGGWIMNYTFKALRGQFATKSPDELGALFGSVLENPWELIFWMVLVSALGFFICSRGLKKGVEKVSKGMMITLLILMFVLVVRSMTLPGAAQGLSFYLKPNFQAAQIHGWGSILYAALGQAFFTLSIGMGSMAIFGSYIGRERRLFGESFHIASLDTLIALLAGLIIFPAAFAFGIDPGEGAGLVFITLPSIFNSMVGGYFFGLLFFLALLFAALSTVIAVFENIIAFMMDLTKSSRKRAVLINAIALPLLSIPTALGFNVWSSFAPLGEGTLVIDLLDFLVSNNILPLGSLVFLMFCVSKKGWGWDNFVAEADAGEGMKIPKLRLYYTYIIPIIILFVFVVGYREKFFQ